LLTVEIVQETVSADPPQARYAVLTPDRLRGRGVGPALNLLKLLLSRPQRFAPADWLLEQFCRGEGEAFSTKRLDTLAWLLRDLLCPPAYESLRRQVVAHIRAMSGAGYQLAGYPLVWVDAEALSWHVEQAVRMERFGDDPLPFWQRAYELARRGEYLPDEAYSEWAEARREEIAGLRRQSVLALARLYPEREGRAGEEQALVILRSYWTEHPRDEDALRPLMELLARRDCYQEALEYYEQLCAVLEEDGQQPDAHTRDVAEYVRTKQIQRAHQHVLRSSLLVPSASPGQNISMSMPDTFIHLLPSEMASIDGATWLGIRLARILSFIHQWNKQAVPCDILQAIIDREIIMFNDMQGTSLEEAFLLSRRQALVTLAALPTMLASLFQEQSVPLPPEEFLPQCAASITACWHLLRGKEFLLIEELLARYLPTLANLAHQASASQSTAARLASQGYRLIGIIALHRNNPQVREACFQQALHFAEISGHRGLLAAALISLAYHHENPTQTLPLYQRGLHYKAELSPLLLARLYARLAVASGQQGQEQEALRYLDSAQKAYPDHPEKDPNFLYAEFDPASLLMEEGLTYLELAQQEKAPHYIQQARQTFNQLHQLQQSTSVPARIQFEIINHQTRAALLMNDRERFCFSLEKGVQGAKLIQSEQRMREAINNYKAAKKIWPEEQSIHALADLFL
jgi:tetratricopeptide (TPR) repeat protein